MNLSCIPSGERRRSVTPWAWLLAGVCLLASMRASAQYDFVVGTEPTVPVSGQAFDVVLRAQIGCQYIYRQLNGELLALESGAGVIRATYGLGYDVTCNPPASNLERLQLGPVQAGNYRIEIYGAPDGNLDQSFLMDSLDVTVVQARVPQPAVIPAGHPAGLATLGGLALLLGWLRLRRGMG